MKPQASRSRGRDSFLERIDWGAVASSAGNLVGDDDSKGLFFNKPLLGDFSPLPSPMSGVRPRLASAPLNAYTPKDHIANRKGALFRQDKDEDDEHEDKAPDYNTYRHYRMTKITKRLFLGNDHDASDEEALRKAKITHVLSMVARKWNAKQCYDIKRKCVPMSDIGNSNIMKLLDEVLDFMEESQKRKNKLLVHCQLGQNRSPTIVMAFLMKYENISFHKAWRKVKQKRVIVQPNVNYIKQLRDWDMYLHRKHSTPDDFLHMKVSGEDISVTNEHANTERMTSVMLKNMEKLQREASNLHNFSSGSSTDSLEDIDIDVESPSPGNEEHFLDSPANLDSNGDRKSYLKACNDISLGDSNKMLIAPFLASNSEDDSSPIKQFTTSEQFPSDLNIITAEEDTEDRLVVVRELQHNLNIDS